MGYVGNQTTNSFSSQPSKQDFTGSSGSSITLSHAVSSPEDISLYINHVRQEPTTSYTVANTTVSFVGYTISATDDVYVTYNALALQTVVPPDGSVTTARINDGAVTSAKLDTNIDIAGTLDSTGIITADAGIKLNLNSATVTGQTVTTNTLTDFEQGTWTPTSAYGTVTANYAFYVKVGNMVTVWTQLQSFSDTSGNAIYVEGLPYASASGFFGTGFVMHRYVNIGNEDDLSVYIANSASNFRLFKIRANGAWSTLTYSLLSTNHQFYITFSYLTG
mgnify:CR=1 FL=1